MSGVVVPTLATSSIATCWTIGGRVIGVRIDSNDDSGFWLEVLFPNNVKWYLNQPDESKKLFYRIKQAQRATASLIGNNEESRMRRSTVALPAVR